MDTKLQQITILISKKLILPLQLLATIGQFRQTTICLLCHTQGLFPKNVTCI